MKTYFLPLLMSFGLTLSAKAQLLEPVRQRKEGIITLEQPQPLVLVNNQETATYALILNPDDIENVKVVKGENALNRFGEKATDGAVIIDLKEELPLVRLKEVYKAFKVPKKQQKLTLAINGKHVEDTALLLADLRQVEKVEVADFSMASSRWSFDEQYLNIITKAQP
ncbi:hypothetical protein [Pontibacter mangrovi]|uniref:TonB-dependent receptor n=1 Tax=Pontibacter mangrovi TaxID=2589816 RepID=A0A501WEW3_9BACT|nr:hypothetical protein [Pontibacter mangrovi]TPE44086.1 hypothetical protein FJM65_11765 [Pontibacter mangrovi]